MKDVYAWTILVGFVLGLVLLTASGVFDGCAKGSPCMYGEREMITFLPGGGVAVTCVPR